MELQQTLFNVDIINKVSLFKTNDDAAYYIQKNIEKKRPYVISFLNAHAYNLTFQNAAFYQSLLQSDIILRDGVGMSILYKSIHKNPGANVNGSDFIPFCIEYFAHKRIALLGTVNPYLKNAEKKLKSKGYNVVLIENGFQGIEDYLPLVEKAGAEIIVLGMGMPKQEQLSIYLKNNLSDQILIFNGGAIIDLWGGKFKRAPKFIQDLKLEWFYRLASEPTRLFHRYVVGNFLFLKRIPYIRKIYVNKRSGKKLVHNNNT